jgi:hypothetical protein
MLLAGGPPLSAPTIARDTRLWASRWDRSVRSFLHFVRFGRTREWWMPPPPSLVEHRRLATPAFRVARRLYQRSAGKSRHFRTGALMAVLGALRNVAGANH